MRIIEKLEFGGKTYPLEYEDCDDFSHLPRKLCSQVRAVSFCDGKLLIGFGGKLQPACQFIGGTIEPGETIEQALMREVQEESNCQVLTWRPIGHQKCEDRYGKETYQLRVWCRVELLGPFVADPGGSITEIKLIDPIDYRQYVQWGKIGERLMERALEIETSHN